MRWFREPLNHDNNIWHLRNLNISAFILSQFSVNWNAYLSKVSPGVPNAQTDVRVGWGRFIQNSGR